MSVLLSALSTVESEICKALPQGIEVKQHPGRFTEGELSKVLTKRKAVRVAVEGVDRVEVAGDGLREATVRFSAFVICSDYRGDDRHEAAIEIVEQLVTLVTYSRWGNERLFAAVRPADIDVENLYSGDLSNGKGIAMWGVSWVQNIRNQ